MLAADTKGAATGDSSLLLRVEKHRSLTLFATLAELFGTTLEPQFQPARPGEVQRSWGDANKVKRILGWTPAWSTPSALRECIAALRAGQNWFRDDDGRWCSSHRVAMKMPGQETAPRRAKSGIEACSLKHRMEALAWQDMQTACIISCGRSSCSRPGGTRLRASAQIHSRLAQVTDDLLIEPRRQSLRAR